MIRLTAPPFASTPALGAAADRSLREFESDSDQSARQIGRLNKADVGSDIIGTI